MSLCRIFSSFQFDENTAVFPDFYVSPRIEFHISSCEVQLSADAGENHGVGQFNAKKVFVDRKAYKRLPFQISTVFVAF